MKVYVTRDDVHAGDDDLAPVVFDVPDDFPPEDILRRAADRGRLPSIRGYRATWVVASNELLAVVAEEWPAPRFMPGLDRRMRNIWRVEGGIQLRFSILPSPIPR
jgi:hypothetical protein